MVNSADLVKSETADECDEFQLKKKKSPKTTIYKSVVTTFILLYHTGVYTFKASFSLYVNMPSSSENYVHRFKVFIAGLNTIKICLIRSVKVRSQALL